MAGGPPLVLLPASSLLPVMSMVYGRCTRGGYPGRVPVLASTPSRPVLVPVEAVRPRLVPRPAGLGTSLSGHRLTGFTVPNN